MKVTILEACDGFTLILETDSFEKIRYWLSDEDGKERLMEIFEKLGCEVEYQEDY